MNRSISVSFLMKQVNYGISFNTCLHARAHAYHTRACMHTDTQARMHTHTYTHTHDGVGGWVSEVFVSTDARRACPRGVIGITMGAYPRGTGLNPVEGNGHFFPSCRQLYLSSFSDTLRPTQRRSLQMSDVAVRQRGDGVFLCMIVFHDGAGGWVSEVFVSTDARRASLVV